MVCTSEDDFTRERALHAPRWVASLSSGERVIQDDGRPGTTESAWLRLGEYVKASGVRVVGLEIQFRSHVERPLPPNADGYFFRRGAGAFLNDDYTVNTFLVGHLEDGVVHVQRWLVPELVPVGREARDPADEEAVGPSLITSP